MFFTVSKALGAWAIPCLAAAAIVFVAFLLRRRIAVAVSLVVGAAAALVALASPPVSDALRRAVEASARNTSGPGVYDAVVVLGGNPDRVASGAAIVAAGRARYLLYSGFLPPRGEERVRAEVRSHGVPDGRLVLENASRNTYENAVESSRVVAARGWRSLLLVTSAAHVERALGCFRNVGLEPDVYPVVSSRTDARLRGWAPSADAWLQSAEALREVVGRIVYRAVGYSS